MLRRRARARPCKTDVMTDQAAAESPLQLHLELWTDLVSPWCWLAKRRLEAAIGLFERPHDVTLTMRAWEVSPEAPRGGAVLVVDHLGEVHGGGSEAGTLMAARVSQEAEPDGITFDWGRAVRANTFDAQRLVALAHELGGPALQGAAVERFHAAHFVEGLAIDDHEVLQRTSAEAGLDERRVAAVLAGVAYADVVRAEEERGRSLGVTSVPYVLANGRAVLAGTRSVDDYLTLLRAVATGAA